MAKTFILSDDSINKGGYRILTSGIDIEEFKKNPVMFWNHHRSSDWGSSELLPIGKWTNIRKLGAQLLADAEFDEEDDFAQKIASKVEQGFINACSIGIRVQTVSDEPQYLLKGQTRSSVIKSLLLECSMVDIPKNGNAMKLSFDSTEGEVFLLSASAANEDFNKYLPIIQHNHKDENTMNEVLKFLGLSVDASEATVLAKVTELQNQNQSLSTENESLQAQFDALQKDTNLSKCTALVDGAITAKKITAAQKETWLGIAQQNFDSAKAALDGMQGFKKLAKQIKEEEQDNSPLGDKAKFADKWKKDELKAWKQENPEEFNRCYLAYFPSK